MSESLRRTALHDRHAAAGARLVPFAGFEMPVQYSSIKEEHAAVREQAGLFDVSHMGQIHFDGPEVIALVDHLVTCDVATLGDGCGTCGSGAFACEELEVVCVGDLGDDALNACGGCAELDPAPGDACGDCGRGTFECDPEGDGDTLVCVGDTTNECGGCTDLANPPGGECESGCARMSPMMGKQIGLGSNGSSDVVARS